MARTLCHYSIGLVVLLAAVPLTDAQSLAGFHIGEKEASLARLGDPTATDHYKSYKIRKWTLPSGNELSITTDLAGKIVYMESDFNGSASETGCDLTGLKFGASSLNDLRKRFGSNGFGFKGREAVLRIPDGVVMINSYEAEASIVTFFTKITRSATDSDNHLPVADRAKLDAISMANPDYAQSEWGERISDPNYKKPEWK